MHAANFTLKIMYSYTWSGIGVSKSTKVPAMKYSNLKQINSVESSLKIRGSLGVLN